VVSLTLGCRYGCGQSLLRPPAGSHHEKSALACPRTSPSPWFDNVNRGYVPPCVGWVPRTTRTEGAPPPTLKASGPATPGPVTSRKSLRIIPPMALLPGAGHRALILASPKAAAGVAYLPANGGWAQRPAAAGRESSSRTPGRPRKPCPVPFIGVGRLEHDAQPRPPPSSHLEAPADERDTRARPDDPVGPFQQSVNRNARAVRGCTGKAGAGT